MWSIGGQTFVFPVGFDEAPGAVLNDHTYCCAYDGSICGADANIKPDRVDDCRMWHSLRVGTRAADAKRLNTALFFTEFGACIDDAGCAGEINAVLDACEEHNVGWAYWQFKKYWDITTQAGTQSEGFYNSDGTL